jgi:hypothetical protein
MKLLLGIIKWLFKSGFGRLLPYSQPRKTTTSEKIQSSKYDTNDVEQSINFTSEEASTKAERLKESGIQYSSQTPFFFKRP